MSLTVEEALKLPCLQEAKIIAGANGINRKISRISVSECKEFPVDLSIMGNCNMLFRDEEIYITSGYAIKEEPELLLDTVKLYSQYNSSGLIIFDRYFKTFDKAVVEYADAVNYPLISMKRETPYSDVIMEISQAILLNDGNALNESIIDELRDSKITQRKIRSLAYRLNPAFQVNNHAICISFGEEKLRAINIVKEIESSGSNFVMFYRSYIMVFFTSKESMSEETIKKHLKYIKSITGGILPECNIGISGIYEGIVKVKDIIEESIIACETTKLKGTVSERYMDGGVYRFLLRIREKNEIRRFYREALRGFNELSEAKREEMMATLEMFVKFDGDINLMSKETFQHANTVRYRIAKLKSILGTESSELEFIMTVNLLYKIRKIIDNDMEDEV